MVGILFTARLGSSRLPRKHLIETNGRTFIEWLACRFINEFKTEIEEQEVVLILATSDEPENRAFEEILYPLGVKTFYGAVSNIPRRHLACAKQFNLSQIISIDGDDILCSTRSARRIFEMFEMKAEKDIFETKGLPLGMNCSGYTTSYLSACLENYQQDKIETGWGRVFKNPNMEIIKCGTHDLYNKLRLTLDYEEDKLFFLAVINFFGNKIINIEDEALISSIEENNFDQINDGLFDIYWNNFNSLKEEEQQNEK